ncbi:MAG TPA: hypothetical protein VFP98_04090 [Candidatus Polarisedimenticolia bacterium]|nr:hypothetical protein [Candidatus Polarisedimenticolia bacterium]
MRKKPGSRKLSAEALESRVAPMTTLVNEADADTSAEPDPIVAEPDEPTVVPDFPGGGGKKSR